MADKPLPWFRLYSEIISDRKVIMIARTTGRSKAEIIGFITILFALASESPERGKLLLAPGVPYTDPDISDATGIDLESTSAILQLSKMLEILDFVDRAWVIRNWNKRQYKSDDSSERVTRFRENQRNAVTAPLQDSYSNGKVTPPDTESDTDTDIEKDKEIKNDSRLTPRRQHDYSEIVKLFMDTWRVKRINDNQEAAINDLSKYPMRTINEFVKWASIKQMRFGDAINSAPASLAKWGEPKTQPRNGKEPKEEPKTGKDYLAGNLKDYIKS